MSACLQVLEVTEQLLRQTDLLADFSHQQLPADSLAGHFLSNLSGVLAQQPALGSVVRYACMAAAWLVKQASCSLLQGCISCVTRPICKACRNQLAPQLPAECCGSYKCPPNLCHHTAAAPLCCNCRVNLPQVSIPLAMSPPKRIGGAANAEPLPLLL